MLCQDCLRDCRGESDWDEARGDWALCRCGGEVCACNGCEATLALLRFGVRDDEVLRLCVPIFGWSPEGLA